MRERDALILGISSMTPHCVLKTNFGLSQSAKIHVVDPNTRRNANANFLACHAILFPSTSKKVTRVYVRILKFIKNIICL